MRAAQPGPRPNGDSAAAGPSGQAAGQPGPRPNGDSAAAGPSGQAAAQPGPRPNGDSAAAGPSGQAAAQPGPRPNGDSAAAGPSGQADQLGARRGQKRPRPNADRGPVSLEKRNADSQRKKLQRAAAPAAIVLERRKADNRRKKLQRSEAPIAILLEKRKADNQRKKLERAAAPISVSPEKRKADNQRKKLQRAAAPIPVSPEKRKADNQRKKLQRAAAPIPVSPEKRKADNQRKKLQRAAAPIPVSPEKRKADNQRKKLRRAAAPIPVSPEKRKADNQRKKLQRAAAPIPVSPEKRKADNQRKRLERAADPGPITPEKRNESLEAREKRNIRRRQLYQARKAERQEPRQGNDDPRPGRTPRATTALRKDLERAQINDEASISDADSDRGEDECSDDDGDADGCQDYTGQRPNDPVAVQRAKTLFTKALEGIAATFCMVCERLLHSSAARTFPPAPRRSAGAKAKLDAGLAPPTPPTPLAPPAPPTSLAAPSPPAALAAPAVAADSSLSAASLTPSDPPGRRGRRQDDAQVLQLLEKLVPRQPKPSKYTLCATCSSSVLFGKVPTLAVVNGLKYPERPAHLPDLTCVEQNLLAPRLVFQHIVPLGRMGPRGQLGLKGSVISIPVEPDQTLQHVIPLLPEEDEVCVVNVKRKLVHKRPYASSYVNKDTLRAWGRFLSETDLYKKFNISFDESRLTDSGSETDEEQDEDKVASGPPPVAHDTLLIDNLTAAASVFAPVRDATTDEINVAPGADKQPLSVLVDQQAEELAFPSVFLGQARPLAPCVSRYKAMKSEVMRVDREGAKPQPLLYKYAYHVKLQASGRVSHRFKRGTSKALGAAVTKEQVGDPDFVASTQKKCLSVPSMFPNDQQYWETVGHDVFAMVRQLGAPTVFMTVSCAEYHWPILISALKRLSKTRGKAEPESKLHGMPSGSVSPEAMESIEQVLEDGTATSAERMDLIRNDPVVCAMYFREIVKLLRRTLKQRGGPMGRYRLKDYFFRIEFQARGSPHLHSLLWLDNAPDEPLKNPEDAARFVDEVLSCSADAPNAERNKHNHTFTCFKSDRRRRDFKAKKLDPKDAHRYCRFQAPFWPSDRTRILEPLYENSDELSDKVMKTMSVEEYLTKLRDLRARLKDTLASESCPDSLDEVWREAECPDLETYLMAIRCGITRPMVLYKRAVRDRWTNPYIPWVLEVLGCNTDGQLVLDIYSLVRYCVSYITKSEKTKSQLHQHILDMRKGKGFDDRALLAMISSKALRAKETSAQEAAWVMMQYPLSEKSRLCRFVDTSQADDRTRSPKTQKELDALPDGCTDVWQPDLYEMYALRPQYFEDLSMAEYVAAYHKSTRRNKEGGKVLPRHRDWILRWRKFDANSENAEEKEDFYRAFCTLHLPWRDEARDILCKGGEHPDGLHSFEALYNQHVEQIMEGRRRFEARLDLDDDLERELRICVAEQTAEGDGGRSVYGTSKLQFPEDDEDEPEYMAGQCDDIDQPGAAPSRSLPRPSVTVTRRGQWDRATFLHGARKLNRVQKRIFSNVVHGIRRRFKAKLLFVDGSAGCGKSVLASNLENAFQAFAPNKEPGAPKVRVSAPTGKAASLIDGQTMHAVYSLPYEQDSNAAKRARQSEEQVNELKPEKLAVLQNEFSDVYGQLIDEISMVSHRNLSIVDQRCRSAKGNSTEPFGGLWTIVFGDFRQLTPCAGASLSTCPKNAFVGSTKLWRQFEYAELTENMRQGEDKEFANILRKIGDGVELDKYEQALIESRFVQKNKLSIPKDAVRIYALNKQVDKYNTRVLLSNPKENIKILEARDRLEVNLKGGPVGKEVKAPETYFEYAQTRTTPQTRGLPRTLVAVVGFPYMLTWNKDTADGLVNGSIGVLRWIEFCRSTNGTVEVRRLWLRFPGTNGQRASAASRHSLDAAIARAPAFREDLLPYEQPPAPSTEKEKEGLVPVEREDSVLTAIHIAEPWRQYKRQQFPLVPGLAFTIYKSQGGTFIVVCFFYNPKGRSSNEEVYVALSRVTKLSGLYIDAPQVVPDKKGRLFQHPRTAETHPYLGNRIRERREERERMRANPMTVYWQPLLDRLEQDDGCLRLAYHNVESLRAHQEDIKQDEVFMAADVILLAETWFKPGDKVDLGEGWDTVSRCDRLDKRGGGTIILSKRPAKALPQPPAHPGIEMCAAMIGSLRVGVMYCAGTPKPEAVAAAVGDLLSSPCPTWGVKHTILCGDFNIDMSRSSQAAELKRALARCGLGMASSDQDSTTYTEGGSVLDAVYACENSQVEVQTYQAYYSKHIPLFMFCTLLD